LQRALDGNRAQVVALSKQLADQEDASSTECMLLHSQLIRVQSDLLAFDSEAREHISTLTEENLLLVREVEVLKNLVHSFQIQVEEVTLESMEAR
jgi:hypothetical protein